jgi:hypothetical protein
VTSKSLQQTSGLVLFKHFGRLLDVPAHVPARSSEVKVCNIYVNVIPDAIRDELCNDVA